MPRGKKPKSPDAHKAGLGSAAAADRASSTSLCRSSPPLSIGSTSRVCPRVETRRLKQVAYL